MSLKVYDDRVHFKRPQSPNKAMGGGLDEAGEALHIQSCAVVRCEHRDQHTFCQ